MQDKETGDITHLDVLGELISYICSEDRWPVTGDGGTRCENILYIQSRYVPHIEKANLPYDTTDIRQTQQF